MFPSGVLPRVPPGVLARDHADAPLRGLLGFHLEVPPPVPGKPIFSRIFIF